MKALGIQPFPRQHRVAVRAIGIVLTIALGYKLWLAASPSGGISDLIGRVQPLITVPSMGIVIVLVAINVVLEGSKWYWLLKGVVDRAWVDCVRDVLLGWGMGLLTPYRLGELVGRPDDYRSAAGTLLPVGKGCVVVYCCGIIA